MSEASAPRGGIFWWLLSINMLSVGCRTPATQIELFIDTDAPVDRPLAVEVFSFNGSVAPSELLARIDGVSMGSLLLTRTNGVMGTFTAGGSIGVLPPSDRSQNRATLWVRATLAATATSPAIFVDRAARVSFVRGRSGTARIFLPLRCGDQSVGCTSVAPDACTVSVRCREQNATCGDLGECVPVEVPVVISGSDGGVEDAATSMIDANSGRVDAATDRLDFPRPVAPISLGDVSLRRPTLRWVLPAGVTGAVVDLCRDRACTTVIESLRAAGTSVRPMRDLPANSVVFWRLRGTVGAATNGSFSPTWLFHVPARDNSGNIDTSSHAHLDLNGDGFDDVVVGAISAAPGGRMDAGTASVYYGTATGVPMLPARVLEGTVAAEQFGRSVAAAGDLNGDGFGDLVVGAIFASPSGRMNAGAASVYHGSAMGISMAPTRVLEGTTAGDNFGGSVAGAGDLNGDGFADLVVGAAEAAPRGRRRAGTASVYHGSAMGISMTPTRVLEGGAESDTFGGSVASAGDLNGDGFADLVIGADGASPGGRSFAGTASVYLGSAMGISMAPARVLEGAAGGDGFGFSVAGAGDVNGDGFGDVVVGALFASPGGRSQAGTASVYHGSVMGVPMVAARVLEGGAAPERLGWAVARAGDVNGDGFGDLVIGAIRASPGGRMNAGTASVYHGSALGTSMAPARVLEGTAAGDESGWSVAGGGDVNGDGFDDLVVGAVRGDSGGRADVGTASVYHGSVMGISMAPARVLEGTAANSRFGQSVAFAGDASEDGCGNLQWLVRSGHARLRSDRRVF